MKPRGSPRLHIGAPAIRIPATVNGSLSHGAWPVRTCRSRTLSARCTSSWSMPRRNISASYGAKSKLSLLSFANTIGQKKAEVRAERQRSEHMRSISMTPHGLFESFSQFPCHAFAIRNISNRIAAKIIAVIAQKSFVDSFCSCPVLVAHQLSASGSIVWPGRKRWTARSL